jgi:hypothetical protein
MIVLNTKSESGIESKDTVLQTIAYRKTQERSVQDVPTYTVLVTQKNEFSAEAVEVGIERVKLIKTSRFLIIMDRIYDKIDNWNSITSIEKTEYIDKILAPFELEDIFVNGKNPILTEEEVRKQN